MKTLRDGFPKISQLARGGGGLGNAGRSAIVTFSVVDSAYKLEAVD